jgi:hypothetical protein
MLSLNNVKGIARGTESRRKKYAFLWLLLTGFYVASMLSYIVNNSVPMGLFSLSCLVLLIVHLRTVSNWAKDKELPNM